MIVLSSAISLTIKGIAHPKMKIIIIYSPAAITCLVINILQNISCIQQKKESRFDQLGGE